MLVCREFLEFAVPFFEFLWTDEAMDHLAQHGVTPEEFEHVVMRPDRRDVSRSSGLPCCWGTTSSGRFLFCVYEKIDELTILPITAYEPMEAP
jgi:hypothetical protein